MARALPFFAAASLLALALTGCAGTSSEPSDPLVDMDVEAAWLDAGRLIGVVTWGSSTCVPEGGEAKLADDRSVQVLLVDPAETAPDRPCTEDFGPRVTAVGVPAGVDAADDVAVTVILGRGRGETSLPALPDAAEPGSPTDYLPSAGWTSSGAVAYVTWGSSTCVPLVQDAVISGDAQVTVTFQEPEPDRMCTMDMVPRVALIEVQGFAPAPGAQLVLTGDTFDNVAVPILGA